MGKTIRRNDEFVSFGTGSLSKFRREFRKHTRRCVKCGRVDEFGLVDGFCNRCFSQLDEKTIEQ